MTRREMFEALLEPTMIGWQSQEEVDAAFAAFEESEKDGSLIRLLQDHRPKDQFPFMR